jgi:hypothetical protein
MAVIPRVLATAAVFLSLAGAAVAAAGKDYPGTSQKLAPTLTEIGFSSLVSFKPAKKPVAAEAQGFKSGAVAFYQKGTLKKPIQTVVTIYVYSNAADAKLAYTHSCSSACPTPMTTHGIQIKAGSSTANRITTLTLVSNCRNVYVAIAIANEALKSLYNDAGVIAGQVYNRAVGQGMSACA